MNEYNTVFIFLSRIFLDQSTELKLIKGLYINPSMFSLKNENLALAQLNGEDKIGGKNK